MKIFPSLICGDLLNLEKTIQTLDTACDGYHIDVMDDHFVPNLTFGPDFVNAITQKTILPCHVHLMVDNPKSWPSRLKLKKDDILIFHLETMPNTKDLLDLIDKIHSHDWHVGLAVNPATPIPSDLSIFSKLDEFLIMSVNPGFSGQKFIPEIVEKVKNLDNIRKRNFQGLKIAIDGGINKQNIKILRDSGVDIFCVGSAIFATNDQLKTLQEFYKL